MQGRALDSNAGAVVADPVDSLPVVQTWTLHLQLAPTCRLKIKLAGSSASGQANGQGSSASKGSQKEGPDRWMAECADCGEEGDLLCCEVGYTQSVLEYCVAC